MFEFTHVRLEFLESCQGKESARISQTFLGSHRSFWEQKTIHTIKKPQSQPGDGLVFREFSNRSLLRINIAVYQRVSYLHVMEEIPLINYNGSG